MSKADTVLEDGLQTELMLQLHLKALRKTLKQQLQETERRQTEELERRIYQNALLSAGVDGMSGDVDEMNHKPKYASSNGSFVLLKLEFIYLKDLYFFQICGNKEIHLFICSDLRQRDLPQTCCLGTLNNLEALSCQGSAV